MDEIRRVDGVGAMLAMDMQKLGLTTPKALANASPDIVMRLRRVGPTRAAALISAAQVVVEQDHKVARKAAKKRLKKARKKAARLPSIIADCAPSILRANPLDPPEPSAMTEPKKKKKKKAIKPATH